MSNSHIVVVLQDSTCINLLGMFKRLDAMPNRFILQVNLLTVCFVIPKCLSHTVLLKGIVH